MRTGDAKPVDFESKPLEKLIVEALFKAPTATALAAKTKRHITRATKMALRLAAFLHKYGFMV
jgi:hypothetical protein